MKLTKFIDYCPHQKSSSPINKTSEIIGKIKNHCKLIGKNSSKVSPKQNLRILSKKMIASQLAENKINQNQTVNNIQKGQKKKNKKIHETTNCNASYLNNQKNQSFSQTNDKPLLQKFQNQRNSHQLNILQEPKNLIQLNKIVPKKRKPLQQSEKGSGSKYQEILQDSMFIDKLKQQAQKQNKNKKARLQVSQNNQSVRANQSSQKSLLNKSNQNQKYNDQSVKSQIPQMQQMTQAMKEKANTNEQPLQKNNFQLEQLNKKLEQVIDKLIINKENIQPAKLFSQLDNLFVVLCREITMFSGSLMKMKLFFQAYIQTYSNKLGELEIVGEQKNELDLKIQKYEKQLELIRKQNEDLIKEKQIAYDLINQLKKQQTTIESDCNTNVTSFKQRSQKIPFQGYLVKELQSETTQLKEVVNEQQNTILFMKDKEEKLIKLLLGVKKLGIDLEKIFEEEILQNEGKQEENQQMVNEIQEDEKQVKRKIIEPKVKIKEPFSSSDADQSIINESQESSFNYFGKDSELTNINSLFEEKIQIKSGKQFTKFYLNLDNMQESSESEYELVEEEQVQDPQKQNEIEKLKQWSEKFKHKFNENCLKKNQNK